MNQPPPRRDDPGADPLVALQAALEQSRVEAAQLRDRNRQQEAVLRRPLVRIARLADRRSQRVLVRVARQGRAVRGALDAAALRARARAAQGSLADRAAALEAARDALGPPPPGGFGVSLVLVGGSGTGPAPEVTDDVDLEVVTSAAAATRPLLCLLPATSEPVEPGWLARLAAAIDGPVVAAVPLLVHPVRTPALATPHDLAIREAGVAIVDHPDDGPRPVAVLAGALVGSTPGPTTVAAASGGCLLVDRAAFEAAGGLAADLPLEAATIDLCTRLRSRGGTIACVPSALVLDDRPVASLARLRQPLDPAGPDWRRVVERCGPALIRPTGHRRPGEPRRIAITVAAPSARAAPQWGDWHLGEALARGLRDIGQLVRLQRLDQADDLAGRVADVHLVLRGQAPVRRTAGQRHVLWIISHPESVEQAEYDEADLVLVASARHAEQIRQRTATPVEVLLQATDHHRFRPLPADPEHRHRVAIVATTRHVFRRSVADALAVGIRPAIYGSGWHEFVDPELIVSEFIPNAQLPTVYASVDLLLNDHWDTMRAGGFVSNRIFDALACGTPVVSDHLPEIVELFGDAVGTYRTRDELADLVAAAGDDPAAARRRAAEGRRIVLAGHTFDHRARTLVDLLDRLDRGDGDDPEASP